MRHLTRALALQGSSCIDSVLAAAYQRCSLSTRAPLSLDHVAAHAPTQEASQEAPGIVGESMLSSDQWCWTASEPSVWVGYRALDYLHATSGLPWVCTIPLATLMMRSVMLPLSLRQARIVRTNYAILRQAQDIVEEKDGADAVDSAPAGPLARLRHARRVLSVFDDLHRKSDTPHWAWIAVNPLIQMPVFVGTALTIRSMSQAGWPGFSTEGALWFPDLTQPALFLDTMPMVMPMGLAGLLLPAAITLTMLTSIRLGFRAAGTADTSTLMGKMMRAMPPMLYTLTLASTYGSVQLPHGALLHWMASSSFTLGLQLALTRPAVRAALGMVPPRAAPAHQHQGEPSTSTEPDPMLVQRVAEADDANLLIVLGAQSSAQQRYADALLCLNKAVELAPQSARAHYSLGQVHSLLRQWPEAEATFRRCTQVAADPGSRGQALYCLGSALQSQGKLDAALDSYREAAVLWRQPVVWYSIAITNERLGRTEDALKAVMQALQLEAQAPSGLTPLLQSKLQQLLAASRKLGHGQDAEKERDLHFMPDKDTRRTTEDGR